MSSPPRRADVVLSRPFVFVNYTSSDAEGSLFLPIRRESGVEVVPPNAHRPAVDSFVYIFVTAESFFSLTEQPLWCTQPVADGENPLFMVFRTTASGFMVAKVDDVFASAANSEFPPMEPASNAGELLADSRLRYFAVGSHEPLTVAALREFTKLKSGELPYFDLFSGALPRFSLNGDKSLLALPVFDPIVITTGLTKKYVLACDRYLGHSEVLTPPQLAKLDKRAHPGQIELLQKAVADTIEGLRKASNVDGGINLGKLDAFLKKYAKDTEALRKSREQAAFNLVKWLAGAWLKRVESWGWNADGTLTKLINNTGQKDKIVIPYKVLLDAVTRAQERLSESDTGVAFMTQMYDQAQDHRDTPGITRLLGKFVLNNATPPEDVLALSRKSIGGVFGAWSSYFEVKLGHIALATKGAITVENHTRTITKMREYTSHMLTHVSVVVGDEIAEFVDNVPVKLTVPFKVRKKFIVLKYDPVQLKLRQSMASKLEAMGLKIDKVQTAFAVLNVALTVGSLWENILEKEPANADIWSSIFDLAESTVLFADQLQKIEKLRILRTQLVNLPSSATAVSARLGMLGAGISLLSSSKAALDNYASHDWDAAAAEATQGVGAVVTGVGYYLILSTPQGGPLGGYFLAAGTVLSLGGLVWCAFAKDTPYDVLAKFSFFGAEVSGAKDVSAPGWALCRKTGTLADWNPNTIEGLTTYLRAAEQLFYSFRISGEHRSGPRLAADGSLRILPSAVRPTSVFLLRYSASWVRSNNPSGGVVLQHAGDCRIELGTSEAPDKPRFVDASGAFVEQKALLVQDDDGGKVIDLTLALKEVIRLVNAGQYNDPLQLFDLTFSVQLDVHGDSKVLVPTTSSGAKRVEVVCIVMGKPKTEVMSSHNDKHLVST